MRRVLWATSVAALLGLLVYGLVTRERGRGEVAPSTPPSEANGGVEAPPGTPATPPLPPETTEGTAPPAEAPSEDSTLPPGRRILGTVLDPDGRPISEAAVRARAARLFGETAVTRTDSSGRFEIQTYGRFDYRVEVSRAGYVPGRSRVPAEEDQVALTLEPLGHLEGRILDAETRSPVHWHRTILTSDALENSRQLPPNPADRTGGFSFAGLPPGTYRISVTAPGHVRHEEEFEIAAGQRVFLEIAMASGRRVRGRVLDSQGDPVEGARVFREESLSEMVPFSELGDNDGRDFAGLNLLAGRPWAHAVVSDDEGGFDLGNVPTTAAVLAVHHPEFAPATIPLEAGGEDLEVGAITLESGAHLHGTVYDARRVPVRGGELLLKNMDPERLWAEVVPVDESGRYSRRGLPAGHFEVFLLYRVEQISEDGVPYLRTARCRLGELWSEGRSSIARDFFAPPPEDR